MIKLAHVDDAQSIKAFFFGDYSRSIEVKYKQGLAILGVDGAFEQAPSTEGARYNNYYNDLISIIKQEQAKEEVKGIVIHMNSGGGTVTGANEAALALAALNLVKPIYCYVDNLCASAAYWVTSQCEAIICSPSSTLGSIGIILAYYSDRDNVHVMRSGKFKSFGSVDPSEEEITEKEAELAEQHQIFKNTVKLTRAVEDEKMQGQTYTGASSVQIGLADYLANSLDEALTLIVTA